MPSPAVSKIICRGCKTGLGRVPTATDLSSLPPFSAVPLEALPIKKARLANCPVPQGPHAVHSVKKIPGLFALVWQQG